ncbi:hypothetical protein [uncultured Chitinophaga sp.]|jgi:3-oxoacyl-[acyl-carrier protein] reductase|uniref:hypothetical protein n=1 Tax=uncultured Chitinophaga sp. TaxID=339340 RepID=UPI002628D403|nr:hypothetical protein [uncultured Chitinophaga sp.]
MKAYTLFMLLLLFTVAAYSQTTINNFKYVLVPERYDFLKEDNQYGLNVTTKLLLQQKGFTAFMEEEALPAELTANKCNALKAEVIQKKGLFVTNLTLLLKDCQGNIVFKSKEGKSREKEFMAAYNLALRDAFTTLNDTEYKYDGTVFTPPQQATMAAAPTPAPPAAAPAPAQTAPAAAAPATAPAAAATATAGESAGTLYAQTTPTGYQLIDTTPKKVLTLLKTSMQDYFIAEDGTSNGVVFKKNNEWYFESYKDGKLVSQQLQIKF